MIYVYYTQTLYVYSEVGSSALHVAVAPATYLSSDTRICRYSATATFIDKAFRFYLIVLNII